MLVRRARNGLLYASRALTGIVTQPRLWLEMWRLERSLPAKMSALALPELMAKLTPRATDLALAPGTVREFADAVSGLDVSSPLGLCLRRSLVRYHFLRRAGVPVSIQFGARFKTDKKIGGHAWLTLDGKPYHEASENYVGFARMYSYPEIR